MVKIGSNIPNSQYSWVVTAFFQGSGNSAKKEPCMQIIKEFGACSFSYRKADKYIFTMEKKDFVKPCVISLLLTAIGIFLIYHNADLNYPLLYTGGDEFGVFYFAKTIKANGWNLVNPQIGGNTGTTMYDYLYSDRLSFGLVWLISRFISNSYLTINLFYLLNFLLTALIASYVCKKLRLSNGVSVVISVLYAFSPYIQLRYSHMWLTSYYLMPLIILSSIKMMEGKIAVSDIKWWKNPHIWEITFISFLSAQTGLYYAFFSCVIYAITAVIIFLNSKKRSIKNIYPLCFCIPIMIAVLLNAMPNLVYWVQNGFNPNNEMTLRSSSESEVYGLKMIQLLLPRGGHRIEKLAEMTHHYNATYPLVNENGVSSLGIIAAIGFIISLLLIFVKDKREEKNLAYLNVGLFLVGTIGGIFSFFVTLPMRSYNRVSIIIMFVSLLVTGKYIHRWKRRLSPALFTGILVVLLCVGFLDQTVEYIPWDYSQLDSKKEYIEEIETSVEENSLIFQAPYVAWPSGGNYRMFIGYLCSDTLRWSYGSMQGRDEAKWQQEVVNMPTDQMLQELTAAGYKGIYIDSVPYVQQYGDEELQIRIGELSQYLETEPLIDSAGELYFWIID